MILPSPEQEFVYTSIYSRWMDDRQRREVFPESVDRLMRFFRQHIGNDIDDVSYNTARQAILDMRIVPSMRALWSAGPAATKNPMSVYNCSFLTIDNQQAFSELLFLLMSGCGVGYSVESRFVDQLPVIEQFNGNTTNILVDDSREGWAVAVQQTIDALYEGFNVLVDYSLVRPCGARLHTMGGRASGPDPLKNLIDFIITVFHARQGKKLFPLNAHDICCKIAEVVVAGGVRRSALISLSDLDDSYMASCKQGEFWNMHPHRLMSNNSAVYEEKPTSSEFLHEWLNLVESGSGERGIFNRAAGLEQCRLTNRRKPHADLGVNPCQPAGATVLTPFGISVFGSINVGDTIWSGKQWTRITAKVYNGNKPTFKFHTRAGIFYGTATHQVIAGGQKVQVCNAPYIDTNQCSNAGSMDWDPQDVMDGLVFGDGVVHGASGDLVLLQIGDKDGDYHKSEITHLLKKYRPGVGPYNWEITSTITADEIPRTFKRRVPDRFFHGSTSKVAGFLRGLYSANGSLCGGRVTLKASSFTVIIQVQQMLSVIGIQSYYTVNKANDVEFSNGVYTCKQSYDLNITTDRGKFFDNIGFLQTYKEQHLQALVGGIRETENRKKKSFDIVDIECIGDEDVFDITVDAPEHTYWTGGLLVSNCTEILLRPMQTCNLSAVVVRENDDLKSLREKVKVATMLGCWQAMFTDFHYVRPRWKENCDEERLLGVSFTGLRDHPILKSVSRTSERWLSTLKHESLRYAEKWSKILGIPMPAAVTCVKPSGDSSQLLNTASGLHPRYSQYYIRRYRISANDPVFHLLKDSGVPVHPEVGQAPQTASTWVLEFPVAAPRGCLTRNDVTAIEQLEYWKMIKDFWCEHTASCTIYVDDSEWMSAGAWVYDNFDSISGLSFLPKSNHIYQLAPYEEINHEQYVARRQEFPKIEWDRLSEYEKENGIDEMGPRACTGGKCDL